MKHVHTHAHGAQSAGTEKIVRRLKIIEGQIRGLQEMVKNDTYCIDVLTQVAAVSGSWMAGRKLVAEKAWSQITALTTEAMKIIAQAQNKRAGRKSFIRPVE